MKKILTVTIAFLMGAIGVLNAQADSTATFKVWGNCDACKSRVEKAAKAAGASKAEWNEETKAMEVSFNSSKTNSDKIQHKIAAVGHDTEKYKSLANAYNKLPGCCKYEKEEVQKPKE